MPELEKEISGRINEQPPTKTAQSSTRIAQRTSIDKFIAQKGHMEMGRKALLAAWQKMFFVATSDGKEMKRVREMYNLHFANFIPGPVPYEGCFELTVIFTFGWLKSAPKKKVAESQFAYKKTSPDTDNMVKALKDAMERTGLIKNDGMICREIIEKRFGSNPGIAWRLRPLMEYQPKPGLFLGV